MKRSKAKATFLVSTDVFRPEQHGSSAAADASKIVPTSRTTEHTVLGMFNLPLSLRENRCTSQQSYRKG
jgi:hypothetical protein